MESGVLTMFSLSYLLTSNSHDAKASSKRCSLKDGFRSLTGMENLHRICLHVSKLLALMPICRRTIAAAAFVVETKMNWSSAVSLVHGCPSADDAAPSVRS